MDINNKKIWDVIVIGGGVIGCAVTRKFTLMGANTLLLERGGDILSGASKANSALLHTGFDATPGSLELECMQEGYREFIAIREKMNLPLLETGALVVAWNDEQLSKLPAIVEQAHTNNVLDVAIIDKEELYRREPHLAPGALAAVSVPGEAVIDPWSTPLSYLTQAVKHGAEYRFHCEVNGGTLHDGLWHLTTSKGEFSARLVINCAGINGDIVESICHPSPFQIKPRKGQFLVYDKAAAADINAIILPVPTAITKGVLLSKTIFGNLLLGPTAEEQDDRWKAEVKQEVLEDLIAQGSRMLPSLHNYSVTATYAGLRPATEEKYYRINDYPEKQWICAGGIRSTGLTSALGVASYLGKLYQENFTPLFELSPPEVLIWPTMPMISEYHQRDYQCKSNGGIVCHCELVTQREIEAAFDSDIPPECLGALRRRTRVMMGRCNGFYCSSQVAEIINGRFDHTLAVEAVKWV
ncbi:NAD(P)/FAD-dependent oxidoreductase [Providencia rettgeri]|nr:NAD(P)/FAD-dependent oxidoreductase [Providencia rettgeri]MDI7243110.1 NAD(P)/FAD-dependent oxidoreductase [Providencia rettgeri]MDK3109641.1 NAD(P)/FAD-dependent oxidoreductase [Providencia rettgeri]MDL9983500.1 NAD(P)/FAD-dependent oxidoreductase [Providencia rettgeri]MDL9989571.1 NAD(P)/FAD-dependent oxidoreductase [Providencia rettgeri]MDT5428926.1 NAD(P)/FAD-dependent oxidoreductase [Providencia rettgeri]